MLPSSSNTTSPPPPSSSSSPPPPTGKHHHHLNAPSAIPPRTSSSKLPSASTSTSAAKPVPLPEGDWLSKAQVVRPTAPRAILNPHSSFGPPSASFTVAMQTPTAFDPARFATQDTNVTSPRIWSDEKEQVVSGPYDYLLAQPGKDFRSQVINAFNALLRVPADKLAVINAVIATLHTASLLIDDVEDSSSLRRGLPVAHRIYGTPQVINSANYKYFCAQYELALLQNPKAQEIFLEELLNLHRGQGLDLYWRDTLTCPTEDDYLEMVNHKTGGLFRLGIKLMQLESDTGIDCEPLVNIFGLIFQIRDDYMNLHSTEYTENKGMCEDLTEGKFSFPVIHSIRSSPGNLQLINILGQKTSDVDVKRYAVRYMESTNSFEYTRQVIGVLVKRAHKIADDIDAGTGLAAGFKAILDKMIV
ncbi:geranylgeranyl pyrophosphate synthetase [Plectosphaerella plurivora]|uniref:Geranylgeranyl pyrophosphate synthetase n=1 Tax=Plectosphaerella plurivora TaxID=936078 RepID=A0A9P9ACG6_9PEZI|nr:geranylgeranyl pyrophosphate synthetase [Plectosphaerella plurivora]